MPDKWEYPWFAAWDLAFHMIPLSAIDLDFAKAQLELMLRDDYLHPNGQIPAYEWWNFGDVNPPFTPGPPGKFTAAIANATRARENFLWLLRRLLIEACGFFTKEMILDTTTASAPPNYQQPRASRS
jgi:hypothetical protein